MGRPLYAKRGSVDMPLTVAGRPFVLGDAFPWRELKLSERQLVKLWEQRRIGHEKPAERNGAEPVRIAAPARVVVAVDEPKRPAVHRRTR